ncbi:pentapeptide repeat-containing protein [Saccharothrix australiensis]|uniref:Pentapeptide repeat protein n=1 Tax=Saccharothrix australiensis TaxID=2072 RepID=A0A495VSA8_9PSEU|nr:pentapeptide repeat-containing protein [Saccharothrix australiensis]RKT51577.1 pentapeptide repeat protein [Saccharothrix australiensis]
MRGGRLLLAASVAAAILVTVATTAVLLWVEPKLSKAEAIKTGGLAGGAVVALYALWLNDRRRRTEEARHELESDKVADERFARAVEMLGNDADQVRVGAMHALAGLARSTPRYKQTVLDVLCAYLRRPFTHPAFARRPDDPDQAFHPREQVAPVAGGPAGSAAEVPAGERGPTPEEDRERTVRLTAQRLITDLLPWGRDTDPTLYHLDLTGASVEYLRLEGRRIGRLTARRTRFHGITTFREARFGKPALFSGATFHGRVDVRDARFPGGMSLQDAAFGREVDLRGAEVGLFLHLPPTPPERIGTPAVTPGTRVKADPTGWVLTGGEHATFEHHVEQDGGGGADGTAGDDR